jgi:hypothetical protein
VALGEPAHDAVDLGVVDERPGGVVHEHEVRRRRQGVERERNRLGAGGAAGDGGGDLAGADVVGDEREALLPALRDGHDDAVDAVVQLERLQRRRDQRPARVARERLRPVGGEPVARAGADDDHPGLERAHVRPPS